MTSSPGAVSAGIQPGDVLAGKYRVERVLGAGGMGVVVAAHHIQLDEKVALKFLLPEASANPEALARFEREARAAVKIKSEHVARVSDVGRLDGGSPYMVMEYLEGGDLADWVHERGPMSVEQAAEFVLQACEAIAEAHALGIVHRDLKPANLFCVRRADGLLSIKVLDFGISKIGQLESSRPDFGMTKTTAVIGSPLYMSPEQMKSSKAVDARTDIWSLGVILFELVGGRVPFEAEAMTELVMKIAMSPPLPLREVRADLPRGFEDLVMHCLEKDRERRFQHVGELAIALRDYAPDRAKSSVERILRTLQAAGIAQPLLPPSGEHRPAHASTMPAPAQTAASWGQTAPGEKRSRTVLVAAIAGAAVVLLGGLLVARNRPHVTAQPAAVDSTAASATTPSIPTSTPASTSTSTSTASTTTSPPPVRGVVPQRPPAAAPATAPAASPATKANCNPPYVIDSAGHRQYKPECL